MKRRVTGFLAMVLAATTVFTGCGGSGGQKHPVKNKMLKALRRMFQKRKALLMYGLI